MQEILTSVPAFAKVIEQAGIIGLLVIVLAFLLWERTKRTRELNRVYVQRDWCRQVSARYKFALDREGIKVDISDLEQQRKEDEQSSKE